jgi:alginate O-acetyltransferase complex protein AlgI
MIFNTWTFAVFAFVTFGLYWTVVPGRAKPLYLCAAGAVFYAYAVPAYLLLVVALGAITYGLGQAMLRVDDPARRRALLVAGVIASVGALAAFKYTRFFAATIDTIARHDVLPIPNVIVPLAVSFFTFEFVHVLVDIYSGKIDSLDPIEFAAFALFFPTLVAGPIKRYQTFAPQLRAIARVDPSHVSLDIYRVVLGLAKKTIVADSMNAFTGPIATPGDPYGRLDYWIAVLAYTIEIYFDFSGYSDMAIGLAGLLGVRVPENFDRPYRAANISDFWRRWHMSLSSWIRDYVFFPLGGSRGNPLVTALNLFLAMAIAGLWHGAAWTFVLWGTWHGVGLIAHRIWGRTVVPRVAFLRAGAVPVRLASVAATFSFVAIGWILFAAPSLGNAVAVFTHLFV